jgi:hypothetical protein
MHPASHFKLKLLPLVDNAWIKPKMQKMQPRASQIDKINKGCYTCPKEQVRYSIASYRSQLHDHQVSQPLDEAKMDLGNFAKNLPLMSKVLNMSKTCQNGKATQTSWLDNHSNHKTITNTHKHLMSCQSHCWWIKDVSLYDPQAYRPHTFFTTGFLRFLSIRGARGLQAFDLPLHTSYSNPNYD